jgi:hypothetical protein
VSDRKPSKSQGVGLWLDCYSYREIGELVRIKHTTITFRYMTVSKGRGESSYFGIYVLKSFKVARFGSLPGHLLRQRTMNELLNHPNLLSLPKATAGMRETSGAQIPPPNKPLDSAITFSEAQERAALVRASELHLQDLRRAHGKCRLKNHGAVTV